MNSHGDSSRALEDWLDGQGLSVNTTRQRTGLHRRLIREWGTLDVPATTITAFLGGYRGWSRRTYHNHLTSVYAWLVDTGQLERNPMRSIRTAPSPRPNPKPLTEVELTRALEAAQGATHAYLLLGYLAGLRAHEIAKFAAEDITRTGIRVYGKGGVGDTVPTHPLLWDLAHRMPQAGWWFPSKRIPARPIHPGTVTAAVTALFRSVGLSGSSHRARHSFGTHMLRSGANLRVVQDLMRHKSLATTALYLGVDEDERSAAIRSLAA